MKTLIAAVLAFAFLAVPAAAQPAMPGCPAAGAIPCTATKGGTPFLIHSAVGNNAALIGAAGPHTLVELTIQQTTTTLMDVRLYDSATAPTCSSATGVVANYVAQSTAVVGSAIQTIHLGTGKSFLLGIGICITGANADNDNTNAATGLNVNGSYN